MIFDDIDSIETAKTKIIVVGVGGGGKNAVNHMIENDVRGVEFVAVNTDGQDLKASKAQKRLLIGKTRTHAQGAGANPEVGRAAALESEDDIHEMIGDAQMVIITCGMGGGTGTGAAPVIARIAREHGCLTIGICTKPFKFEGPIRANNAALGLEEMRQYVDSLIVVPNQRLLQVLPKNVRGLEAFREADNVLRKAVQGVAEIIQVSGLVNLDFADIKNVMQNKGTALLGIGAATGDNRAVEAARQAVESPLLEVSIDGATDAVVNISTNQNYGLREVEQAIEEIRNKTGKDLNIIYGHAINSDLGDEFVITVIATGYELKAQNLGLDDISEQIFRNMSEENISIPTVNETPIIPDSTSSTQHDIPPIFDSGKLTPKEQRRRDKEEARLKKQQEKKNNNETSTPTSTSKTLPDWLRRK